jgi:hypothetical protein
MAGLKPQGYSSGGGDLLERESLSDTIERRLNLVKKLHSVDGKLSAINLSIKTDEVHNNCELEKNIQKRQLLILEKNNIVDMLITFKDIINKKKQSMVDGPGSKDKILFHIEKELNSMKSQLHGLIDVIRFAIEKE